MSDNKGNIDLKERTKRFSIRVIRFCSSLPKTYEFQVVGRQLIRSATSVGANTRASFRGRSNKEFIAKLGIVIEEADESAFWLEILRELEGIDNRNELLDLEKEANEITAIFNSIKSKNK